jgi:hypothetical protein
MLLSQNFCPFSFNYTRLRAGLNERTKLSDVPHHRADAGINRSTHLMREGAGEEFKAIVSQFVSALRQMLRGGPMLFAAADCNLKHPSC